MIKKVASFLLIFFFIILLIMSIRDDSVNRIVAASMVTPYNLDSLVYIQL